MTQTLLNITGLDGEKRHVLLGKKDRKDGFFKVRDGWYHLDPRKAYPDTYPIQVLGPIYIPTSVRSLDYNEGDLHAVGQGYGLEGQPEVTRKEAEPQDPAPPNHPTDEFLAVRAFANGQMVEKANGTAERGDRMLLVAVVLMIIGLIAGLVAGKLG
jgi:hypothetical protein